VQQPGYALGPLLVLPAFEHPLLDGGEWRRRARLAGLDPDEVQAVWRSHRADPGVDLSPVDRHRELGAEQLRDLRG
jgi:hypothetical protein